MQTPVTQASQQAPATPTVILSAPIDWGKTRHADALRREYGCSSLVDDWEPSQALTPGALHLTNVHPGDLIDWGIDPRLILRQGWPAQPCMQAHHQRGNILFGLITLLGFALIVCLIVILLGASHYIDDWHVQDLLGPDDVATAQRVADDLADAQHAAGHTLSLSEAVLIACGPNAKGQPVPGTHDIQCFDQAGRPTFYAVGGQP